MVNKPTFEVENSYLQNDIDFVFGIDEVGRGSFAGPLVASAVCLGKNFDDNFAFSGKINDSKKLSPTSRDQLSQLIKNHCIYNGFVEIDVKTINKIGIGKANNKAFFDLICKISQSIKTKKAAVLIDGTKGSFSYKFDNIILEFIIKGDQKSLSIASASILAKVYRDSIMCSLFPEKDDKYFFSENKGYGTEAHRNALKTHGLSEHHRLDFCKKFI